MGKQLALASGPNARNVVQHRTTLLLLASSTVTGDGEAVSLVPQLLEKVHGGAVRRQCQDAAPG